METCGMSLMKYLLFIFNFIFVVSGIAIIVAGGIVLCEVKEYDHFMESRILGPPIVLIVAGSIVFLVAFLGCCGAIKENYHMLIAFAVLLLIIFIVELAVGIAASVAKDDFSDELKTSLKQSMGNYTNSVDKTAWDDLQTKMECCGVEGPTDWQPIIKQQNNVPKSCCKRETSHDYCLNTGENTYQDGCFAKLQEVVRDGAIVLMGVGIGIAFIELVGIVFAFCLASAIKKGVEK